MASRKFLILYNDCSVREESMSKIVILVKTIILGQLQMGVESLKPTVHSVFLEKHSVAIAK